MVNIYREQEKCVKDCLIQLQVMVSSFREHQPLISMLELFKDTVSFQKFSFVYIQQPQNILINDMELKDSYCFLTRIMIHAIYSTFDRKIYNV